MKVIGVIPARYKSTRFPGKPLALVHGIPMVVQVYKQAMKAESLDGVVILTDDKRIYDVAIKYECHVMMTPEDCKNGTERLLRVFKGFKDTEGFVSIQGDEPLINPDDINMIVEGIRDENPITTLIKKIRGNYEELNNKNVVKVAHGFDGRAVYFSRLPIPYHRDAGEQVYWKHIGIYGFTRETLRKIKKLKVSHLEDIEKLEQLKWLEHGIDIYTYETEHDAIGVDTLEDLKKINENVPKETIRNPHNE